MPVLWRSAFQAHRPHLAYPGTAYPVTIASLCSAFQALNTSVNKRVCFCDNNGDNLRQLEVVSCGRNRNNQRNIFAHEFHEWARRQCATGMATGSVARIITNAMRGPPALTHFLPLKTIHTRHWRGLLADLQMVICYGLRVMNPARVTG